MARRDPESSEESWDEKSDKYKGQGDFWQRAEKKIQSDFICRPQALRLLGDPAGREIADLGCGEGYVSRILASAGAKVTGIEISPTLLAKAREAEAAISHGIVYLEGDVTDLHAIVPSASFDCALSINVSPHLSAIKLRQHIGEAARIVKPGGVLVFAFPHPDRYRDKAVSGWWTFDYDALPTNIDTAVPMTLYSGDGRRFPAKAYPHSTEEYLTVLQDAGLKLDSLVEPLASTEDLQSFPNRWGVEDKLPFYLLMRALKGTVREE